MENGVLRLGIYIETKNQNDTTRIIGPSGAIIGAISDLAAHDLQGFFECEVFIRISVIPSFKTNPKDASATPDTNSDLFI